MRPNPQSSAEIPILAGADRLAEIEHKQGLVAQFLQDQQLDALLLLGRDSFAWFTCGGDNLPHPAAEPSAALFLTADARVVVTDNVSSPLLFERELAGLGFQLKERPWHEGRERLLEDLCRQRRVGTDLPGRSQIDVSAELAALRLPLTPQECVRLKSLGRDVAHAVEATARRMVVGTTEADIAGELAHRLSRRQVSPEVLQVVGDRRRHRFRTQSFTQTPVRQMCTLMATGRRDGLYVSVSRTLCFGPVPDDFDSDYNATLLVQATGLFFSQAGWSLQDVWQRVARIYEKTGHANEWLQAPQAEVTGYRLCEQNILPDCQYRLLAQSPVAWHPSIGPAVLCDTMLIGASGGELLTPMENWPRLRVRVKNASFIRPGILRRQEDDQIDEDSTTQVDATDTFSWLSGDDSHVSESVFD